MRISKKKRKENNYSQPTTKEDTSKSKKKQPTVTGESLHPSVERTEEEKRLNIDSGLS